jgi:hypothetical protein
MRSHLKCFRIKISVFLFVFFIAAGTAYTQSVLTLDPGTSMGVLTGTDLCVNIRNGTGILYGGGTLCGGLVSVEPVTGTEIPREFALMQNYPNPFNPVTNIGLRIAELGFVSVRIYDISGKEVAILVNEELSPGVYNVEFDGSNLASGTYFYRMETNSFSDVKKMILVK